ncbi:DNA alkylation repair protein [Sulfitobacter mediterraneus]|uniref:DNA alkylation repair protein n=1 Tax=Sulfitobacter mediterraneus TaxID=83219 RepID=UPI001932A397|nr:DNA alkylation repair protein [Sulfitobacter mediterraneus]MBM1632382.1 DNA alkylation repair protein [Sulfitobacter mediterraneus]MBM1640199.1 DNA alkylation repair protein [Sulfitobacter mediterraneus]MBM1644247.1 DNA alkylation repair protein [Sulfitobacter mediterraneus]MBM1648294.1 DNA alkylation repair protein [Sulfitobacter mediterraneus]MBM1652339.1 DNA alkylation repair protein [Sulfitobacter mediterraneus]
MAEKFSLKDHLFNPDSVGDLASEFASALPDFDAARFQREALAGFAERELLARMEWMADCLEAQLARDFPTMAAQLEAAMPPPLDPSLTDDDFGRFIHGLPGILAVRHGLEDHRERALDLLYQATKRFSMEFYIRPFLNRWPDETLARMNRWVEDENYHVRRLVSEGTRPKLPWAKAVTLSSDQTLPLLARLHADKTRYVTRSVSNHLNDIAKTQPDVVVNLLRSWDDSGKQSAKELAWMTRHSLRTLIKQGHGGALDLLGYRSDVDVAAQVRLGQESYAIGEVLSFEVELTAKQELPVLVDYRLRFARPQGKSAEKVFKLKTGKITAGKPLILSKNHRLKGDATTFTLHPGAHQVILQVNGVDVATADFELT